MVGKFQTPSLQQSFGTQYHGTQIVSAFMYDVSATILYTIYPTINYDVFLNVPLSLGQSFATADAQLGGSYRNPNIPYPDDLYEGQVSGVWKQCILCESGAPILCENGNYLVLDKGPNPGNTQVTWGDGTDITWGDGTEVTWSA